MSKFKIGDKVRCVNARSVFKDKALVEGDIYTVEGHDENDYGCISLCERDGYFYEERFELVEEPQKMSRFKDGDKVRCVSSGYHEKLVEGDVYTIQTASDNLVTLHESGNEVYFDYRFELVEEPAKEPVKVSETPSPISIDLKRAGNLVSLKVDGQLTREQVESIMDIVYGKPKVEINIKPLQFEAMVKMSQE